MTRARRAVDVPQLRGGGAVNGWPFCSTCHQHVTRCACPRPEDPNGAGAAATEPALAGFLLARIAEDEREAREWRNAGAEVMEFSHGEPLVHRTDPWKRVLVECEAKRRTVERLQYTEAGHWAHWVLLDMAYVYSDHPDHNEAWGP